MKPDIMDLVMYEQWLTEKRDLSEGSVYIYKKYISMFLNTNPDIDDLNAYNNFLVKDKSKKRTYAYLYALRWYITFKFQDNKELARKLIDGLVPASRKTGNKKTHASLSEDARIDVINNIRQKKHRVIAFIQSFTGVRARDILMLKRNQVLYEEYRPANGVVIPYMKLDITHAKGEKRTPVQIFDMCVIEVIDNYLKEKTDTFEDYCFIELGKWKSREGDTSNHWKLGTMNYNWYLFDLKQALQQAKIDYTTFATHDFRRCFAKKVWEKYRDVELLKRMLHHTRADVTLKYLEHSGLATADINYELQMK